MAEEKHTAGEWRADLFEDLSGKYAIRGGKTVHGAPFVIAWVNNPQTARAGEPQANRALIEAVPDLLAACKAALATHGCEKSEPGLPTLREVEDMLRVAIAKAEGSSHA